MSMRQAETDQKERLSIRLAGDHKELIEQAARISGQSISDFVKSVVLERSRTLIREASVISLTAKGWGELMTFIEDADDDPNEALRGAAERNSDVVNSVAGANPSRKRR
jgi:uncharacterized protein (DUF1778 family)